MQLASAVAIEWWRPGVIDPDYGARLARIRKGRAADPEHTRTVVMFGSSRTQFALHAEELDALLSRELGRPVSVVNFGFPGAGPGIHLLTWQRLRRDGVRPALALVEVLPPYLNSGFEIREWTEDEIPTDRLRWSDLPLVKHYAPKARAISRRDAFVADLAPLGFRGARILHTFASQLLPPTDARNARLFERFELGPFPNPLPPDFREKATASAGEEYKPFLTNEHFHIGGRGCEAMCELLRSCREAGVPAVLVVMPEGPVFRSWYAPETWARIQHWLEQTSKEFDAPIVNAREWLGEESFIDSHHLMPDGAAVFTERLGRETILPALRRAAEPPPARRQSAHRAP